MVAAAILIGAMVFAGGFFSYQLVNSKARGGLGQDIPIGGYVVIKAYHSNGKLFATWSGHNTLSVFAVNAIANCISGVSDTPDIFGTCSSMTSNVWVQGLEVSGDNPNNIPFEGTAANSLLPSGCISVATDENGGLTTCTGWQTTGTITFSGSDLPVAVDSGGAEGPGVVFDQVSISPTITVNAGDSLVVTVTFSIT